MVANNTNTNQLQTINKIVKSTNMKNTFKFFMLSIGSLLLINCKKITENVGFTVNGDVIKYGVTVQFWDPKSPNGGLAPQNIFVKISGKDASKVYEFGGTKTFTISSTGLLSLGLDPFVKPTVNAPICFTVEVYASDYASMKIPVSIDGTSSQKLINVTMVNLKNPPNGVSIKQTQVQLASDGSVLSDVTLTTVPTSSSFPEVSSITIPSGTKFKNASGSIISSNGSSLQVTQIFYSTRSANSLSAFPQNSFMSDSIYDDKGNRTSGYFYTSGFTSIEMSLNGQDVKYFTNPISVSMDIDPSYKNPKTQSPVNPGDKIPVYSYDFSKNRWTYENTEAISSNYTVNFTTTHLTVFSPAWTGTHCSTGANVTFNTHQNIPTQYLLDIFEKDGDPRQPLVAGILITASDGQQLQISASELPIGNVSIRVYPNNVNNSQLDWTIREQPLAVWEGDACSAHNFAINLPLTQNYPAISFNIIGRCPGNILVYPTVPTFYRKNGSNAPYTYLGTVVSGQFTTTNLQLHSTYDFLWLFKNREFTKTKTIDSLSYSQIKNVGNRFAGDTLVDLFCY
jgi:hypothetical protein